MKKIIILSAILFLPATVSAYAFHRNLSVGDSGEDVRQLQVILNSDIDTRVATSGVGSPGRETDFFGALTKLALIRFQNKYKAEVLIPAGLFSGTGFFGPLSRKQAFNVSTPVSNQNSQSQTSTNTNTQTPQAGVIVSPKKDMPETRDLMLYSALPHQVRPNSTVSLEGENLTPDAILHIGDLYTTKISGSYITNYKAVIPAHVPVGEYEIWLTNSKGSSRRANVPVYLVVAETPNAVPVISSVSPSTVSSLNTTITVTGTGFTDDMSIASLFGSIDHLSSRDGKTFTFNPVNFSNYAFLKKMVDDRGLGAWVSVPFYVVNYAGASEKTANFIVK